MAEYILREAAIKRFNFAVLDCLGMEPTIRAGDIIKALESIPAADVRPVVLCRDCKHKGWVQEPEHGKSVDYCRLIERCVDKQFFCAAGERKANCGADMREES